MNKRARIRLCVLAALATGGCHDQIIGALPGETTGGSDAGSDAGSDGDASGEPQGTTAASPPATLFVAVGERARRLTTDDLGDTWPFEQLGAETDPEALLQSVAFGEARVVAVGGDQFGRSAASEDGLVWSVAEHAGPALRDVVYGNGGFVAVGFDGRRARSTDGLVWEEVPVDAPGDYFESIAFGDGVFVATGYNGLRLRSVDGWTWTDRWEEADEGWTDVAHGNGRFLAISRNTGRVVVSEDGVDWIEGAALGGFGKGICFGDGEFLALGEGTAFLSIDGMSWETHSIAPQAERCAYGQGVYIALEGPDRRWRSADGVSWEELDLEASGGPALYDIAFGELSPP